MVYNTDMMYGVLAPTERCQGKYKTTAIEPEGACILVHRQCLLILSLSNPRAALYKTAPPGLSRAGYTLL